MTAAKTMCKDIIRRFSLLGCVAKAGLFQQRQPNR